MNDNLRQTYRFIEAYHARLAIFPTQREVGRALGISSDAAGYRLRRMHELGWLVLDRGRRQSMVLKGLPERAE
jgi:hypothetical protein